MPPKKEDKLAQCGRGGFRRMDQDGSGPRPASQGQAASKGYKTMTLAEAKTFWAFQQPKQLTPGKTKNTAWAKSPIDQFLFARHAWKRKGYRPVAARRPRAPCQACWTFDLIGLPPTPEEIDTFVKDAAPNALEKVVDRLLGSPHFGERWGRHWLDIARYAETNGNADNTAFPNAYHYRD